MRPRKFKGSRGTFGVGSSLTVPNLFEKSKAFFPHRARMEMDERLLALIGDLGWFVCKHSASAWLTK